MPRPRTPRPIRFRWRFTRARGWEGRRDGEKLLRSEYGYPAYEVAFWLFYERGVEPHHWEWRLNQYRVATDGQTRCVGVTGGTVANTGDINAAMEQAMTEAEAAYVSLFAPDAREVERVIMGRNGR
jgi:hypothetical protein